MEYVSIRVQYNSCACRRNQTGFDDTAKSNFPPPACSLNSCQRALAGAAEPDKQAPVCAAALLIARLLLCLPDCLQAEWAPRTSGSLATCEHSPALLRADTTFLRGPLQRRRRARHHRKRLW